VSVERIAELHAALLFTILLVLGALALWSGLFALLGRPAGSLLLSGLAIGELLLVAEALLGVVLYASGLRPARSELHLIYGLVAVALLPAAMGYAHDRPARQRHLTYALACLFVCALALRALETGRG
jgi:hypothetical protein